MYCRLNIVRTLRAQKFPKKTENHMVVGEMICMSLTQKFPKETRKSHTW